MPTPALDFLQKVRTWQDAEGASSGLPLLVPARDLSDLDALLTGVRISGPSPLLEDRARRWLISYREIVAQQGGLTAEQERELDSIVACIPLWNARQQRERRRAGREFPRLPRVAVVILACIVATALGLGLAALVSSLTGSGNSGPPPAGPVVAAPQQPAPGALTELQQLRADWDIPASATADAGNPRALVLLQDGLFYPSPWTVPPGDPGWQDNLDDAGFTVTVHGSLADVTDSTGITYTVAVGQPFVLASNTQLVLRVIRDGTIQSMPQPHAIRVRYRL